MEIARFTWDPEKSRRNLAERGFDFHFATQIFDGDVFERHDKRIDYGEPRVIAIGAADGTLLTVVYTDRTEPGGEVIRRIISTRVSNHRERQTYTQSLRFSS